MTFEMEIGGVRFRLDPAAISSIRYRAAYGDSIIAHLAQCETDKERERRLLRMCHCMIPAADRPELPEFARLARKDERFLAKAQLAFGALFADDPRWSRWGQADGESFDEYQALALLASAHVDMRLLYELPLVHLVRIADRYFEMQGSGEGTYKEMDAKEMAMIYPR